ncbi:hypothetical protein HOP50_15g74860 [Chloropicon primus]|uniref:Uncharacterized protein n=1 Tax=Chloropicon primus TaxID=1764295 RepID=A0A5B8MWN5_9CHLO|nr:hypothetical protein A3770_15p74610 [Chloropicon primus]UPR04152.1 hypothetical protein HOP50_15g74860 [Chloropicon primus]|mmetsp:Transcript_14298/g.40606  ORF Transcript_14298/g.40606 Transcript_14298/m.40606 type:complete len:462 (-) Transcript_14298:4719-6104(-)|eukprot:QDZ24943.1 hypothetical protein A3770_15p74610 [Chloropicon primus]
MANSGKGKKNTNSNPSPEKKRPGGPEGGKGGKKKSSRTSGSPRGGRRSSMQDMAAVGAGVGGQTDVYGDLFNLGPTSTYGSTEDPTGLFPTLYFDDGSVPMPTPSWDVMPNIPSAQEMPPAGSVRCSTPVSNYNRADSLGGAGAGMSPYESAYYMPQSQGYNNPHPSSPSLMYAPAGVPGSSQQADTYTPMGSYGQGQGAYHGRMRYSQHPVGSYGMPYASHHHMYPGSEQQQQQQMSHDQHRAMSHYGASTIPPMSATTMSSSHRGGHVDLKLEGASGKGESGAGDPVKDSGASSSKKKGELEGGRDLRGYMQPAMGLAVHGAPGAFYQGAYGHQPMPQQQVAPGGAFMGNVPDRRMSGMGKEHSSGDLKELNDRQLSGYIRPMLYQLQQLVSILDFNTRMTISESLLRLATAKEQSSAGVNPDIQTQEEKNEAAVQKVLDRSVCQLLYNSSRNEQMNQV